MYKVYWVKQWMLDDTKNTTQYAGLNNKQYITTCLKAVSKMLITSNYIHNDLNVKIYTSVNGQ